MKKIFSVLLALIFIFSISACSKEEEDIIGSGILIGNVETVLMESDSAKFTEKEIENGYEYNFEQYEINYICKADINKNIYSIQATIPSVDLETLKDSDKLRRTTEGQNGNYSIRMLRTVECPLTVAKIYTCVKGEDKADGTVEEFYKMFDGSGKELKVNSWTIKAILKETDRIVEISAEWQAPTEE